MRIVLLPGYDDAWRAALTPWQEKRLASLFRQGRHLRDRTNHGDDMRWAQAGVKTRDSHGNWHRNSPRKGHERVLIEPTDYGYVVVAIRRQTGYAIDPDSGAMASTETWIVTDRWYVGREMSANYPPGEDGEFVSPSRRSPGS